MNIKGEKGITLIILVATLIVLIIITGVTVYQINYNDGLLTKSQETQEKFTNDVTNTEQSINTVRNKWGNIIDN